MKTYLDKLYFPHMLINPRFAVKTHKMEMKEMEGDFSTFFPKFRIVKT